MKKISPRITPHTAEFLPTLGSTLNWVAEYTLNSFPTIYRKALHELKGVFSSNELKLIIDVFNSTSLTAQIAGQHLRGNVEDGIALDHLDSKWEVDKEEILKKTRALKLFDCVCLELWANSFWYAQKHQEDKNRDLDEYIKTLL